MKPTLIIGIIGGAIPALYFTFSYQFLGNYVVPIYLNPFIYTIIIVYAITASLAFLICTNKRYSNWLKGGLLGVLIGIITIILGMFTFNSTSSSVPLIIMVFLYPLTPLGEAFLFAPILYFIIGSVTGWIIGKCLSPGEKNTII